MEPIPGLPEDIGVECLIRSHYKTFGTASKTCQIWQKLLKTSNFHHYRKKKGYSQIIACLVQSIPEQVPADEANSPSYGINLFDSASRTWERLSQVPKYPNGLPLFCQVASSEGKLVVMGGWDPVSYNPVKDVFVYDFKKQLWRQGKDMPSKRSFFSIGAIDGNVYIAGGHDENKNALKSATVYNLRRDEWTELTQMNEERDECEGVVIGNEFWVVSGYNTNSQGVFSSSAESYSASTGMWNRVDSVWQAGLYPRLAAVAGKNGKPVSCTELTQLDSGVSGRACGIELGEQVLVTGLSEGGGKNKFFLVDIEKGKMRKMEKIDVPDEFCGFVQSGCCVEI